MRSFTSRTSLLTALAIAGVLVAGTAAIAANIGILNSTDDSSIGSLSATDDLVAGTSTTAMLVPTTTTTSRTEPTDGAGQSYLVDDAGAVVLSSASGNLTLLSVVPEAGWTVTSSQPDSATLEVSFSNGARTVVFSALLGPDGVVTADVVEPVDVTGAPTATPATTTIDDRDDEYEYEYDDDDDDHDDDHYEGADDDD